LNTDLAGETRKSGDLSNLSQLMLDNGWENIGRAMTAWSLQMRHGGEMGDNFYRARIDKGQWLAGYELVLIEYVLTAYNPETTCITEVGCGYGTLALMLRIFGYQVNAVDGDRDRVEGARFIRKIVGDKVPSVLVGYQIFEGFYPNLSNSLLIEPAKTNIMITTNLVSSFTARRCNDIIRAASEFDELIIDISRFGLNRSAPREALIVTELVSQYFDSVTELLRHGDHSFMRCQSTSVKFNKPD
jgi:hypothetical protein